MAIIGNAVPPAPDGYSGQPRRVVVKLKDAQPPSLEAAGAADPMRDVASVFPGLSFKPYFTESVPPAPPGLEGIAAADAAASDVQSYLEVGVPPGADAVQIAQSINARPEVEIAYVEGGPTPPPVSPNDDPMAASQGYLNGAPAGIDARWAWSHADGRGVGFVDLERGWTLDHEDLAAGGIAVISGINTDYHGHGTAVLGQVVATDNTRGVVGIAPAARARVVSQWRNASRYHTAEAILGAAGAMQPGDVLLLEAQTTYPTSGAAYVPVEVERAVFDAIRIATRRGIIVVEAGGNGSVDLDSFVDTNGQRILDRASPDFRDSGAIMVGAASAAAPHRRLGFSNFGSRIDCHAWGEAIVTCGDGWTGNAANTYTSRFGGTSGASPIVAGAALILQSWAKARGRIYAPQDMRRQLSSPALNTRSGGAQDRIGVMPNLRAIIEREAQGLEASPDVAAATALQAPLRS